MRCSVMVNFIDKKGYQKTVPGYVGQTLLEVAHNNGIELGMEDVCQGAGSCAECHVLIANEWYNTLPQTSFMEDSVLEDNLKQVEMLSKKYANRGKKKKNYHRILLDMNRQTLTKTSLYAPHSSRLACQIVMEKEYDGLVVAVAEDESDFHFHFSYVFRFVRGFCHRRNYLSPSLTHFILRLQPHTSTCSPF